LSLLESEVAVAEERTSLCATAIGVLEDVVGVVPFEAVLAALVIELELSLRLVLAALVIELELSLRLVLEIAPALVCVCVSGVAVLVTAGGAVVSAVVDVT
jgi:hypothetical protein